MAAQIHVKTEPVSLFSTDMNKRQKKLELSKIFCFLFCFVCFWDNIICTIELLILFVIKVVLTTKFDLSLQQTNKGYNIHTYYIHTKRVMVKMGNALVLKT